jgi:hypothetical protein
MAINIVLSTGRTSIIFQLAFHYMRFLVDEECPPSVTMQVECFFPIGSSECNFLFPDNFSIQMAVSVCSTVSTRLGGSAECPAAIPDWGGLKIF